MKPSQRYLKFQKNSGRKTNNVEHPACVTGLARPLFSPYAVSPLILEYSRIRYRSVIPER